MNTPKPAPRLAPMGMCLLTAALVVAMIFTFGVSLLVVPMLHLGKQMSA